MKCKFEFYFKDDDDVPFYRFDGCEEINDAGMINISHAVNNLIAELKKEIN